MRLENREVDEDIADLGIVTDEEAEPARDVEPFERAGHEARAGFSRFPGCSEIGRPLVPCPAIKCRSRIVTHNQQVPRVAW
ncbi:hypothetical protein GCM10009087_16580 [Sphingomonas oligophenolica]